MAQNISHPAVTYGPTPSRDRRDRPVARKRGVLVVKISRTLTILTASGGLAMLSLMSGGAASAGTYTSGDWTLQAPGSTTYAAQVLQPINSDGSSVFNHKSSTIPVQYKVTQTQSFAFESVVSGDSNVTPGADTGYSLASYTMPAGVTVGDLTSLVANFTWAYGANHSGGFRWQVGTPDGNIMVDYGDANTSLQTGTAGSGDNMIGSSGPGTENRCESGEVGGTLYTPWSYVVSNFGSLAVNNVVLVVDGGWGGPNGPSDQVLNLTDATVSYNGVSSTFTMPGSVTTQSNASPAWIYLYKVAGATPAAQIDEQLITSTQRDSGGQFRQVDSKYIYNLPVSNLPDPTAKYQVGISFNSDGSAPAGVVGFGLK
jgi:hypothetical protein